MLIACYSRSYLTEMSWETISYPAHLPQDGWLSTSLLAAVWANWKRTSTPPGWSCARRSTHSRIIRTSSAWCTSAWRSGWPLVRCSTGAHTITLWDSTTRNQKSLEALQLCPGPDHRGPDGQSALQWCEQVIFARSIVVKVLCLGLTFLSSSTTTSGVDLCSLSLSLSFSTRGLLWLKKFLYYL